MTGPQWFHENSVVLIKAQNKSVRRVFPLVFLVVPASRAMKCDSSSGVGRRVRTTRKAVSTALRSSGARSAIRPGVVEEVALDLVAHDVAVHEHEALGDRAAAGVEFVFARVAIAADEIVAAGVRGQTDEPVRLGTKGRERRTLEERPGHLFGSQAGHREDGPGFFLRIGSGCRPTALSSRNTSVAAMVRISRWRS